jgi:hypothetical protein
MSIAANSLPTTVGVGVSLSVVPQTCGSLPISLHKTHQETDPRKMSLLRLLPSIVLLHVSYGFFISSSSSSIRQAVRLAAAAHGKNSSDIAHDNVDDYRHRIGVLRNDNGSNRKTVRSLAWKETIPVL